MSDILLIIFTINQGYKKNLAIDTFKKGCMFLIIKRIKYHHWFLYKGHL